VDREPIHSLQLVDGIALKSKTAPFLLRPRKYIRTRTSRERWEENAGYSPSTLAMIIAALCAGTDLARAYGHTERADFALAYADWLNSHVENWCVTTVGERLPGKPRHYVRITPADPLAPRPSTSLQAPRSPLRVRCFVLFRQMYRETLT
jgi:GH15 family glucan-1,4-alpha-glucosidase